LILDEDGQIGLATPSRSGLNVLAKAPLLTNRAWTVPTLVGSRLYVRDRKSMMAVELN
jgi:outer membrane protein assembly factor BamB